MKKNNMHSLASRGMVAILAASMSCGLLASCSSATDKSDEAQGMTDDEIMAVIEKGDADTLAKAKAETEKAVSAALAKVDKFTDEDKAALKKSILDEVDSRLSGISGGTVVNRYVTELNPTYTTQEGNTYVVAGEKENQPRIEDGTPIPATWDIERTFDGGYGHSYKVENIQAQAYNFAEDTPYAGGDYAYRIEVVVSGSFTVEPPKPGEGIPQASSFTIPADIVLSPYDVKFDKRTGRNFYDSKTFSNTFTVYTNMLPGQVYAVMQ